MPSDTQPQYQQNLPAKIPDLEIKIAGMDIKIKGGEFIQGADGKYTQTAIVKLTRDEDKKPEDNQPKNLDVPDKESDQEIKLVDKIA